MADTSRTDHLAALYQERAELVLTTLRGLATPAQERRLEELENQIDALQADELSPVIAQLETRAVRLQELGRDIQEVIDTLPETSKS